MNITKQLFKSVLMVVIITGFFTTMLVGSASFLEGWDDHRLLLMRNVTTRVISGTPLKLEEFRSVQRIINDAIEFVNTKVSSNRGLVSQMINDRRYKWDVSVIQPLQLAVEKLSSLRCQVDVGILLAETENALAGLEASLRVSGGIITAIKHSDSERQQELPLSQRDAVARFAALQPELQEILLALRADGADASLANRMLSMRAKTDAAKLEAQLGLHSAVVKVQQALGAHE